MISIYTKKKELIGNYRNDTGCPEMVKEHDFVGDIAANAGWVSVGIHHDMAAFAANAICRLAAAAKEARIGC